MAAAPAAAREATAAAREADMEMAAVARREAEAAMVTPPSRRSPCSRARACRGWFASRRGRRRRRHRPHGR